MKIVRESLMPVNTQSVNEGWKENIVAGLMLLFGVGTGSVRAQQQDGGPKDGTEMMYKQTTDANVVKKLLRQGWTLESTEIDTIWQTVIEIEKGAPGSAVIETGLVESAESFVSGGFELTDGYKAQLEDSLQSFSGKPFINIVIEASSDKQVVRPNLAAKLEALGYTGDNAGLTEARADAIKDYLVNDLGVSADDNSIVIKLKPEQGQGTPEEYKTGEFRYTRVYLNFVSNVTDTQSPATYKETRIPKVQSTYNLSARLKHGGGSNLNTKVPTKTRAITKMEQSKKWDRKGVVPCSFSNLKYVKR